MYIPLARLLVAKRCYGREIERDSYNPMSGITLVSGKTAHMCRGKIRNWIRQS